MGSVPRTVTVLVDSREKNPLLFPERLRWHPDRNYGNARTIKVAEKRVKLDAGDYCLAAWPEVVGIERKGSISELHNNLLTADYARFTAAFSRFQSAFRAPYLLIDCGPTALWRPTEHCPDPRIVWDGLCREVAGTQVRLLWSGPATSVSSRRLLGEQVLRLMLAHCLR